MVRLEVIEIAEPSAEALDKTALYAAVSDKGQKAVLMECLKRAFYLIQKYADKALLPGTFRICADGHSGAVRVYMGGQAESVTDSHGSAVSFIQCGNEVRIGADGYCEVIFTTGVNEGDYASLLPLVMKYATALYDGKDSRELNLILKEAL